MTLVTLDQNVFNELQGIMEDAMVEFLNTYMDNSPKLIEQMETALAAGDTQSLFHTAHQLKGGSGSLGACRLADLSLQIEQLAKAGSLEGVADLLSQLKDEYGKLSGQLQAYL